MLGIYGGTFNPVHFGHLRTALEIQQILNLSQVLMIPCRLPMHRPEPDTHGELRLAMLELAIAGIPGLTADRRELDREGPSYTIDTLRSLKQQYPSTPLALIIGADAFSNIEHWHDWQNLFDFAHIVVMTRPGFHYQTMSDFLQQRLQETKSALHERQAGYLFFQTVSLLEISASKIREILAAEGNPQCLLPDSVLAFIKTHQLYQAVLHS